MLEHPCQNTSVLFAEGRDNLTGLVRLCLKVETSRSLKQAKANVSPRARAFVATCQDQEE
ncbi:hypothetical protein ASPBRDRAFT_49731, partial [Aspergillus brasiliensis CBS 101740]